MLQIDVRLAEEFALQNKDGLTDQADLIILDPDAHHASASGRLKADHLRTTELLRPEGAKATVGRTGDRIFVDARCRGEEARDKIELRLIGRSRYDNATTGNLHQLGEIRVERADFRFAADFQ